MSSRFRTARWLLAVAPVALVFGWFATGSEVDTSPRAAYASLLVTAPQARVDSSFAKLVQRGLHRGRRRVGIESGKFVERDGACAREERGFKQPG